MSSWRSLALSAPDWVGITPLTASAWRTQFRMLVATAKLTGQFVRLAPGTNQVNHLLTKVRRIGLFGGMRYTHFGLLLQEQ